MTALCRCKSRMQKFSNEFVNFYGLSGIRTWWRSWVHIRVCCGQCEVHLPLAVIGGYIPGMFFVSLF